LFATWRGESWFVVEKMVQGATILFRFDQWVVIVLFQKKKKKRCL
jgi:hypothetical protein